MVKMKATEILDALERIRSMVQVLTGPDGSVTGIDQKFDISLALCEQLLQDGMKK